MNNTYIFLRHAETKRDPRIPAVEWSLTDTGLEKISEYLSLGMFSQIDAIITSTENKAIATARPIAHHTKIIPIQMDNFNEVARSSSFESDEVFMRNKQKQLCDWSYTPNGGESGEHALRRFNDGLENINSKEEGKIILIVSHGTILTLYFSSLLGSKDRAFADWQQLPFCAVGIVQNDTVIKSIFITS